MTVLGLRGGHNVAAECGGGKGDKTTERLPMYDDPYIAMDRSD